MIHKPHVDWFALSPSLSMLGAAGLLLLVAVFAPKSLRRPIAAVTCGAGFVAAFVFGVLLDDKSPHGAAIVADSIFRDRWTALAQIILAGCGVVAVLISYSERMREENIAEYYALLAAAGAGMAFFVQASNLMTLFLGLEWFSIALYVLCAIDIDLVGSLEAGLKYLIIGAVGSATLLFGSALVYGATGQLDFDKIAAAGHSHDSLLVLGLAMVIAGLAFKSSAAPFHMWTPDAYQGAPTPVTAFMSSATKVAAFVVSYRLLVTAFPTNERLWTWAIAGIAIASLLIGNLAALAQRNVKRLLAYSSVSHAGFMLIPISAASALGERTLLYYLIPYCAMSLGAFAVVAARERELGTPVTLDNLAGFGWERPFLGVSMAVFVLGFLGFPVTGGAVGKLLVFSAAYDHGWWWLVVIGAVGTMISAAYYLAVVRAMFFRDSFELQLAPAGGSPPRELTLQAGVAICLAVSVGSLVFVQPLLDLARSAANALPLKSSPFGGSAKVGARRQLRWMRISSGTLSFQQSKSGALGLVIAVALATLAAAGSAAAYKKQASKADQASAQQAVLKRSDLPSTIKWSGGAITDSKTASPSTMSCAGYDPKQSDLVRTGDATTQFTAAGTMIENEVSFLGSSHMVNLDWNRTFIPALVPCLRHIFQRGATAVVLSAGSLPFPRVADHSAAYRLVIRVASNGQTSRGIVDLVAFGSGRAEVTLTLVAFFGPTLSKAEQNVATAFDEKLTQSVADRILGPAA